MISYRFQVCDATLCELVDASPTFAEAESVAISYSDRNTGHTVAVYDVMARRGAKQLWHVEEGRLKLHENRPEDS